MSVETVSDLREIRTQMIINRFLLYYINNSTNNTSLYLQTVGAFQRFILNNLILSYLLALDFKATNFM